MVFSSIDDILADVKEGKQVIIVDDPDRENEGDVFIAAQRITPEGVGFMRRYATGLICVPMMQDRLENLNLFLQNPASHGDPSICRFTDSVDLRGNEGVADYQRAATISALVDLRYYEFNFRVPGHVHPLRADYGGLTSREGHTEAAVELARFAGLYPAGVICEIVNQEDGNMARRPELEEFAKKHNIRITSVADIKRAIYG